MLGTVLDGIPDSFVLGASILQEGVMHVARVVAVFVSNVPEALSGTAGLLRVGWIRAGVFRMWSCVVLASSPPPLPAGSRSIGCPLRAARS